MTIDSCVIIDLPKVVDQRGNLTFIESGRHVSFEFKRIFYLYDIPGEADRGGHALKRCHQFVVAMSGSFDVVVGDGRDERRVQLDRPNRGLYIPPMIWRSLDNFSSCAVCMVVASENYDEDDYFRSYDDYLRASR